MRIYTETRLEDFEAWSGAIGTLERIVNEDKCDILEQTLEELYPDGMDEAELNDLLWFDADWCYEVCGLRTEEQIREELDGLEDELEELMESYRADTEECTQEEKDEIWYDHYCDTYEILCSEIEELEEEYWLISKEERYFTK